jgi:hypothetical protein
MALKDSALPYNISALKMEILLEPRKIVSSLVLSSLSSLLLLSPFFFGSSRLGANITPFLICIRFIR